MISLSAAVQIFKQGGMVVYPTDTAYALGCIYNNKRAIRQIMALKGRTDPKFTVIASSLAQVEKFFTLTTPQRRLAKKYWPGPLSIVVSSRYAVRVPQQSIARALARRVGQPLLATSLNRTGRPTVYSIGSTEKKLLQSLPDQAILNIGTLKRTPSSTIVACRGEKIIIYRHGPINPK
ncbi:MAG: L-threonylcarbamoyladenylate synthase [Candidatus Kerfeldbacteria bacterium]|nr:L-threonylcarbamoyladenylate synthase [Candidatus Kerfeldbacteria bacterium]